jgi:hypothetical protein
MPHRIDMLGSEARIELDAVRVRDGAVEALKRGLEQGKPQLRERLPASATAHADTPDAKQLAEL